MSSLLDILFEVAVLAAQGAVEICDQIVDGLDTDGQANQRVADAELGALVVDGERRVYVARGDGRGDGAHGLAAAGSQADSP